ncbi:RnfABCDGE type electron transport complex subunit D [Tissierella creatinophila]|uniref:Na(+)-translocating NADH-quinone reductase subunit B n=1 Tax=Tissierella creatinophila DSM 6911 TaxID=1123403 RepID=A0A1U7M677_TISCR|nr:RnfABCDGE type electron transport complex subunit D [Tissierella creatinophila]OLS02791.1 Na(+)-translocating NADH-quinone reductase subunit B [Tissierella creatinophila DSM 6911]
MLKESFSKYFMNQKMMRTVIISLIPIIIGSIFFFGWRTLILLSLVTVFGVGTEYVFEKRNKKKISEAVFVTCILYTMTLPPSIPYWIAIVGIIFGVMFGKAVFGGFGRNVFNPALVARAFVYVSFPVPLTIQWSKAASGFPGGFATYITEGVEAVSQATPMLIFRNSGDMVDFKSLLIGNISGSIGETSAILIILAGVYLIYKKVASWEIMAGTLLGFLGLGSIIYFRGNTEIANPLFALVSGGFLFGTVFMATDPVSGAKTKEGKWIYGVMIGVITMIIRTYSLFTGGMMFAILISNTFVPILDEAIKGLKKHKKEIKKKKEGVAV